MSRSGCMKKVDVLEDSVAADYMSYRSRPLYHRAEFGNIVDRYLLGSQPHLTLLEGVTNLQEKSDPCPRKCGVYRIVLSCSISNLLKEVNPFNHFTE
jgi:hypothetical protein